MKKLLILTIAVMTASLLAACSLGSAEDARLTDSYLPEGAKFLRTEADDGFTEHIYTDENGEYRLLTHNDGSAAALEYDAKADPTAKNFALSADEALDILKITLPDAELIAAAEDRDDGLCEWDLLITSGEDLAFYELDAADGTILDYVIFYGLAARADLPAILEANLGNAAVTELSLDTDDARLYLEGEARTDSGKVEFSIDAASGILVEAEYDD